MGLAMIRYEKNITESYKSAYDKNKSGPTKRKSPPGNSRYPNEPVRVLSTLHYFQTRPGPELRLDVQQIHAGTVGPVDRGVSAQEQRTTETAHQRYPLEEDKQIQNKYKKTVRNTLRTLASFASVSRTYSHFCVLIGSRFVFRHFGDLRPGKPLVRLRTGQIGQFLKHNTCTVGSQ